MTLLTTVTIKLVVLTGLCCAGMQAPAAGAKQANDPNRVVRIAVLQAGAAHSESGNLGCEANFRLLAGLARQAAEAEPEEATTEEAETVEADLAESGGDAGILGLAAEGQPAEGVNPDRSPLGVYVRVIKPGWGNKQDNRYYPHDVVKRDAGVFEGAKMYTTDHRSGDKSERTEVSVLEQCPVYFAEDGSPVALARIFDPDFAEKTRNRARAGQLQTLRCSIYAKGVVRPGFEQDGRKGDLVEAIRGDPKPDVDWVTRDGAGGHAVAMAEAEPQPEPLAQEAVEAALAETNLPQAAKEWVAEGTYADEAQLQEAVGRAVERVKKLTGSGQVFDEGRGAPAAEQGMTQE